MDREALPLAASAVDQDPPADKRHLGGREYRAAYMEDRMASAPNGSERYEERVARLLRLLDR